MDDEEEEYSSRPLNVPGTLYIAVLALGCFFYSLTHFLNHSFIHSVSCVTVYGESPDRRQRPYPLVDLS